MEKRARRDAFFLGGGRDREARQLEGGRERERQDTNDEIRLRREEAQKAARRSVRCVVDER